MVMANIPRAVVALSLTLLLVLSPLCTADYILYSGETLRSEQYLSWKSYKFIMQSDCNLVLYDTGNPVWASKTVRQFDTCYVTLQSDGNLVIYNNYKDVVWASNTHGKVGSYFLILQHDRNVVIYDNPIWATNIPSKASIKVDSLPANATHASNAAGIAMIVNN